MVALVSRARCVACLLLALLAGCTGKKVTEIVVGIASDLSPGTEVNTITLDVHYPPPGVSPATVDDRYRQIQLTWDLSPAAPDAVHLPASVGLLPGRDLLQPVLVTVRGLLGTQERVRRQAQLLFAPDRVVLLQLNLLRRCNLPVSCSERETCGENGCEEIVKDSSTLPDYVEGQVSRPWLDARTGGPDAPLDGPRRERGPDRSVLGDSGKDTAGAPDVRSDAPKPKSDLPAQKDLPPASDFNPIAPPPAILWTKSSSVPPGVTLHAVWGSTGLWSAGTPAGIFAVGDSCTIIRCGVDGSSCATLPVPFDCTSDLYGVWGSNGTVTVVGAGGRVMQSTGFASFTSVSIAGLGGQTLRDVWGKTSAGVTLWVVAGDGIILHNDGSWHSQPVTHSYNAVWGRTNQLANVWVVGDSGMAAVHPGATWIEAQIAAPSYTLRGVWGTVLGPETFALAQTGSQTPEILSHGPGTWQSATTLPPVGGVFDLSGTTRTTGANVFLTVTGYRSYVIGWTSKPTVRSVNGFPALAGAADLQGVHVLESNTAVAVGPNGQLYTGTVP